MRETRPASVDALRTIPLSELVESPWNPRKHFDPVKLAEMVESLRKGQLAPIIVRPYREPQASGTNFPRLYEIGAGHRRFRSAPAAGMTSLLAIVRDLDDVAFLELLTIENKQREDVAPLDEANGFRLLMEKAGYDVAKLAARIGLSTKYVYDRLKLLQLEPAAKKMLEEGEISAGHAILLARLSPADQKRAIGSPRSADTYSMNSQTGGLFRPEHVEGELRLAGGRAGVRSVRELQQWIHDNVRMKPETMDGFLFPETVQILAEARENKDKVVHITYDYMCSDGARDPKERTYGKNSWKRADGRGGKRCDRSVIGHVVAGPHQGDAFRVCVNRDRCKTHWRESATRYEKRQKAAKPPAAVATSSKARQPTDAERRENEKAAAAALRQQERNERIAEAHDAEMTKAFERRIPEFLAGAAKRTKQLAGVPDDAIAAIYAGDFWPQHTRGASESQEEIQDAVQPKLPGKWSGHGSSARPRDTKAMRSNVGLSLFIALDTDGLDETIEREAVRAAAKFVAAQEAADKKAEKKPAPKKPKKGSR